MNLGEDVYEPMHGPQWNVTGNLKGLARLGELDVPRRAAGVRRSRASAFAQR
jgi:hypothetical protein